jgi:hypothetical protein
MKTLTIHQAKTKIIIARASQLVAHCSLADNRLR